MEKAQLKKNIGRYYPLYKTHGSRLKRLIRSPIHTGFFYLKNIVAHIHPYQVSKRMPWGADMSFYLPEANQIYYYDFWEINISNLFINILEPGDVFIDIGAHVGYYSSLAAVLVGESGKVIAFEPTPRTFANTEKNLRTFKNAQAINKALSDTKGTVSFTDYGPKYSAFNSLTARSEDNFNKMNNAATVIDVETDTLDSILTNTSAFPTVIKIDAEGAESAILRGAEKTIVVSKPLITFEVGGDARWNNSTTESFSFLKDAGYVFFTASTDGNLIPHEEHEGYTYDNIVAIHESKMEKYRHLISG